MKQMTEAELRKLLEEAYEAGAADNYQGDSDKQTRDEYVNLVMEDL